MESLCNIQARMQRDRIYEYTACLELLNHEEGRPMTLFHQPLFNQRFLAKRIGTQPTPPAHKKMLVDWADTIRSGVIRKQKETELRGPFIQRFFVDMLGYRTFGNGSDWTINDEKRTGSGSADTALGIFSGTGKTVVAHRGSTNLQDWKENFNYAVG